MKEGDVGLASLQQADGQQKLRPVLLLKQVPFSRLASMWYQFSMIRQAVPDFR